MLFRIIEKQNLLCWVLEFAEATDCTLNTILYASKDGLEGAGKEKDVCGVYLPILCELDAEFKCEQVTRWE